MFKGHLNDKEREQFFCRSIAIFFFFFKLKVLLLVGEKIYEPKLAATKY